MRVYAVVLARAVSATPPSIVIVAPVLGGPECVRALCWKAAAARAPDGSVVKLHETVSQGSRTRSFAGRHPRRS